MSKKVSERDKKRYRSLKKKVVEGRWSTLNQGMRLLEGISKLEQKFRGNK